jgi:O-antigen/teichoic acid export membrane protein
MSSGDAPNFLQRLRGSKLTVDIAFSIGSFAILAVSGLAMSLAIAALRDASALGIFNRAYAVLIVASQFGAWGIHYSVLRLAAFHREDPEQRHPMLGSACLLALALGVLCAAATHAIAPLLQGQSSDDSVAAIRKASLGLVLFPLNKVLLAYLNGMRMMRAFALLQSLRYLLVMLIVIGLAASGRPISDACLAFPATELVLATITLITIRRLDGKARWRVSRSWVSRHLAFGSKAMFSGMFAEVNSRLDVLLIGYFTGDRVTGIYSFAAMLADGLYHVVAMVRINFNPILVAIARDRAWDEAARLRAMTIRYVLPVVLSGSVALVLALLATERWVVPDKGLAEGIPSLLILLGGLNLVAWLVPLDNLMLVSGHPAYQTLQQVIAVAANLATTLVLLPLVGMEGAAIGTVAYLVANALMLLVLARALLGWNIIAGTHRQS